MVTELNTFSLVITQGLGSWIARFCTISGTTAGSGGTGSGSGSGSSGISLFFEGYRVVNVPRLNECPYTKFLKRTVPIVIRP